MNDSAGFTLWLVFTENWLNKIFEFGPILQRFVQKSGLRDQFGKINFDASRNPDVHVRACACMFACLSWMAIMQKLTNDVARGVRVMPPTSKLTRKNAACRNTSPRYRLIYNSTVMGTCRRHDSTARCHVMMPPNGKTCSPHNEKL